MSKEHHQDGPKGRFFIYAETLWHTVKGDSMKGLSSGARVVWLVLFAHADAISLTCNPSLSTIARLGGFNPSHVTRPLAELEEAGLIERHRSKGGRARTSYQLISPAIAPAQQPPNLQGNYSSNSSATAPHAPAQHLPSRQRDTNHDHKNPNQKTHSIQPGHGVSSCSPRNGLPHIEAPDLTNIDRLVELHRQWRGRGHTNTIDADLLNFVAAATHAANVEPANGTSIRNRPALFASMVRSNDYSKVTQSEEDEARRRLSAYFHGTPSKPRKKPYNPFEEN